MGLKKFHKIRVEAEPYWNLECIFSRDIFEQIEESHINQISMKYNQPLDSDRESSSVLK